MKWINTEMPHVPTVDPIMEATIKELRGSYGVKKLGGVGYCFGGKYVCRWLKEGKLDAGYTAHPSFVEADEVKGIEGPLSISAAGTIHIHSLTVSSHHHSSKTNPSKPKMTNTY